MFHRETIVVVKSDDKFAKKNLKYIRFNVWLQIGLKTHDFMFVVIVLTQG